MSVRCKTPQQQSALTCRCRVNIQPAQLFHARPPSHWNYQADLKSFCKCLSGDSEDSGDAAVEAGTGGKSVSRSEKSHLVVWQVPILKPVRTQSHSVPNITNLIPTLNVLHDGDFLKATFLFVTLTKINSLLLHYSRKGVSLQ